MKKLFIMAAALLTVLPLNAQSKTEAVKEHLENHFKVYGFIRNYFAFDTRESSAGTEDLYYYMPKDVNMSDGVDLNAIPSFRWAALTTRVGLDVSGYEIKGYKFGAKVETDFYCGVSGVTGTAQLRLRQAFVTVNKDWRTWKVGQAWHPMAADFPDILSLEVGVPFGAFSRTPQVALDFDLGKGFSLTASALWQMQYASIGPSFAKGTDGTYNYNASTASANYIKYACTPEGYLGLNFKNKNLLFRLGADVLSIKPRNYEYDLTKGEALKKVGDRITTYDLFFYGQEKFGNFTWKQKVTYVNDGSHLNFVGGYGVSAFNADGSWEYSATRNLSAWTTFAYKAKAWTPSLFLGYIKEFGTSKDIVGNFWAKNYFGEEHVKGAGKHTVSQMFRIQPDILYTIGKFQIGLEYMYTGVEYGKANARKLATTDLHWVGNHRVQAMVKFNF